MRRVNFIESTVLRTKNNAVTIAMKEINDEKSQDEEPKGSNSLLILFVKSLSSPLIAMLAKTPISPIAIKSKIPSKELDNETRSIFLEPLVEKATKEREITFKLGM
jgi:hypothetical protein